MNCFSDLEGGELLDRSLTEAEKFAYTLLNHWTLGQCDEDIIIFYSLKDNVVSEFSQ